MRSHLTNKRRVGGESVRAVPSPEPCECCAKAIASASCGSASWWQCQRQCSALAVPRQANHPIPDSTHSCRPSELQSCPLSQHRNGSIWHKSRPVRFVRSVLNCFLNSDYCFEFSGHWKRRSLGKSPQRAPEIQTANYLFEQHLVWLFWALPMRYIPIDSSTNARIKS